MAKPLEYPIAADIVVFALSNTLASPTVLLIRRGNDPYQGQFALPGGFVDPGEVTRETAQRELSEETGLDVRSSGAELEPLGAYGPAGRRDPRGDILTVAYWTVLPQSLPITAGDDAASAEWVSLTTALTAELAFDHDRILRDAVDRVAQSYPRLREGLA